MNSEIEIDVTFTTNRKSTTKESPHVAVSGSCSMGQQSSRGVVVQGTVAPGFESVKEMFQQNFARGAEDSAQLCVYLGDKKVADISISINISTIICNYLLRWWTCGALSLTPATRRTP